MEGTFEGERSPEAEVETMAKMGILEGKDENAWVAR